MRTGVFHLKKHNFNILNFSGILPLETVSLFVTHWYILLQIHSIHFIQLFILMILLRCCIKLSPRLKLRCCSFDGVHGYYKWVHKMKKINSEYWRSTIWLYRRIWYQTQVQKEGLEDLYQPQNWLQFTRGKYWVQWRKRRTFIFKYIHYIYYINKKKRRILIYMIEALFHKFERALFPKK